MCYVEEGSVASKAGLRFGDQILQINGQTVAGKTFGLSLKIQILKSYPGIKI